MIRKKIICVLSLILLIPVITITAAAAVAVEEIPPYEKLIKTAQETGYARVILKLAVKDIDRLTENSTQYKTIVPGARFPSAGFQADLELEKAIEPVAFSVLYRLNGKGYRLNHTYNTLPYLAVEVSAEALALLPSFPEILDIYEDIPTPLAESWQDEYYSKRPREEYFTSSVTEVDHPMLGTSIGLIGADDAWTMGYTGSGWYVAVLDTGIRLTHQFFQGKTIVEACFSANSDCPNGGTSMYGTGAAAHYESSYESYDHGTHVSGIATGDYGGLSGVAKSSNIIAVQVFSRFSSEDCYGAPCLMSYSSDQVAGLAYVYSLRSSYSISSVNMSLGSGPYSSYCDSAIQKSAIDNLKAVGIATVIATGNNGYCGYISSPACISSAVAVGASTKSNIEAYFNNWHETLQEFFAPGVSIYSSTGDSDSSYESWNGTSMATPHVTGAWALLRQASPSSSVDEIFTALTNTGDAINTLCVSGGSLPLIQVDAAITALVGTSPTLTVTSPNGGESWIVDSSHNITWTSSGSVSDVKIEYSINNGSNWTDIITSTANDGTHAWTVPNAVSANCLIRISEIDGAPSDSSDAVFAIIPVPVSTITVTSPNGSENWPAGSSQTVTWTSTNITGTVTIDIFKDGVLAANIADTSVSLGSFAWNIPYDFTPGNDYQVCIHQGSIVDYSDSNFSILYPPFSPLVKPDLNRDGKDDILWRYYGTGGYNAVWLRGTVPDTAAVTSVAGIFFQHNDLHPARQDIDTPGTGETTGTAVTNNETNMNLAMAEAGEPGMEDGFAGYVPPKPGEPDGFAPFEDGFYQYVSRTAASYPDPRDDPQAASLPSAASTDWHLCGVGDINKDGKIDLVWRNVGTGANAVWYMDGLTRTSVDWFPSATSTNWTLCGTGDFNNDGNVDLVWRNVANGSNTLWLMNGLTRISISSLPAAVSLDWTLCGTGDFNNDGNVDLVWRNMSNGTNAVWFMSGLTRTGVGWLPTAASLDWILCGTGDFNNDGKVDLIWRHNGNGNNAIWYMNGTTRISVEFLNTVTDATWKIEN